MIAHTTNFVFSPNQTFHAPNYTGAAMRATAALVIAVAAAAVLTYLGPLAIPIISCALVLGGVILAGRALVSPTETSLERMYNNLFYRSVLRTQEAINSAFDTIGVNSLAWKKFLFPCFF